MRCQVDACVSKCGAHAHHICKGTGTNTYLSPTHDKWNHSVSHASLSHPIICPYDTCRHQQYKRSSLFSLPLLVSSRATGCLRLREEGGRGADARVRLVRHVRRRVRGLCGSQKGLCGSQKGRITNKGAPFNHRRLMPRPTECPRCPHAHWLRTTQQQHALPAPPFASPLLASTFDTHSVSGSPRGRRRSLGPAPWRAPCRQRPARTWAHIGTFCGV